MCLETRKRRTLKQFTSNQEAEHMTNLIDNENANTSSESRFLETLTENMFVAGIIASTFSLIEWFQYWSVSGTSIEEIALQIGAIGITAFASNCFFGSLFKSFLCSEGDFSANSFTVQD